MNDAAGVCVYLFAPAPRYVHSVHEECVKNGQRDKWNPKHKDDVEPGVEEFLEDPTVSEFGEIAADVDDMGESRMRDDNSLVLEELWQVEGDATGYDAYDNLTTKI